MTTIYQAISAVMGDVREVRKSDRNQTQGFNFRGIDAVMNAVGPALRTHGVIVVPTLESHEYATVVIGKNRTEMGHAQLVVTFTWYGPEGDSLICRVAAEAMDSGDKAIAKAHSVALRTAMIETLALPTDEPDADESTYQRTARKPPVTAAPVKVSRAQPEPVEPEHAPVAGPRGITDPQKRAMHALFTEHGYQQKDRDRRLVFVSDVLGHSVESSNDLNSADASRVIDALKRINPIEREPEHD